MGAPLFEDGVEFVQEFLSGVELDRVRSFQSILESHRIPGRVVRDFFLTDDPDEFRPLDGEGHIDIVETAVEGGDPERDHVRLVVRFRRWWPDSHGSRVGPAILKNLSNDTTPFTASRVGSAMTDYTTVSIPKDLADRVEKTIEGTSFSSTSDLVRFLLRSIVIQHQRRGELTEAEFELIAEQLQDLGYLE